jgi:hypothetical protein
LLVGVLNGVNLNLLARRDPAVYGGLSLPQLEKLAADPSIESHLPRLIIEYRQLTKLVNTYLIALKEAINPQTGRVHASFNQTVASTGRLSSSDPNLQNIPIRNDLGMQIRCRVTAINTAGDADATCPPAAQHAVRQGKHLAENIIRMIRGQEPQDYAHRSAGAVATLGHHQGVAEIYGVRLKGWPAWALHRLYHVSQMPTVSRKTRVLVDWMLDGVFPRQVVAIGELHEPRDEFVAQARR